MNVLTLTDYVKKQKTDPEFVRHYEKEQIINNIAKMIVNARKDAKLSQAKLAELIGTTQSVIARAESGNSAFIPSLETLVKIANALNMKLQLRMSRK